MYSYKYWGSIAERDMEVWFKSTVRGGSNPVTGGSTVQRRETANDISYSNVYRTNQNPPINKQKNIVPPYQTNSCTNVLTLNFKKTLTFNFQTLTSNKKKNEKNVEYKVLSTYMFL